MRNTVCSVENGSVKQICEIIEGRARIQDFRKSGVEDPSNS